MGQLTHFVSYAYMYTCGQRHCAVVVLEYACVWLPSILHVSRVTWVDHNRLHKVRELGRSDAHVMLPASHSNCNGTPRFTRVTELQ